MADVFDKDQRSQIMQKVKSHGNKSTEMKLISVFSANRISGWRRNYPVKGHPDFVFLKEKIAVLWTVAFGMGMTAETLSQPIIKSIGIKKENKICGMIKKSPLFSSLVAGWLFGFGNASCKRRTPTF